MNVLALVDRFRSHANLPGSQSNSTGISLALRQWRRERGSLELRPYTVDLVTLIQSANALALGEVTDEQQRRIAYAMSCVIAELASTGRAWSEDDDNGTRTEIWATLDIVAHAWCQFLAGDIDDILADIHHSQLWPDCWGPED